MLVITHDLYVGAGKLRAVYVHAEKSEFSMKICIFSHIFLNKKLRRKFSKLFREIQTIKKNN